MADLIMAMILSLSFGIVTATNRVSVAYDEIIELSANCTPLDNCKITPEIDGLDHRNCNCGSFCATTGTCCVDSTHRSTTFLQGDERLECSNVYGTSGFQVFMINKCKKNWNGDPSVESQCIGDGDSLSDPLLTIPVTSNQTGDTYKNYFCYRCNEDLELLPNFWLMHIRWYGLQTNIPSIPIIKFNNSRKSWTMLEPMKETFVNVYLEIEVPARVLKHVKTCRTGVISTCASHWTDDATKSKCSSYMALIYISKKGKQLLYRNVHCALCSQESLEDLRCYRWHIFRAKKPFSFSVLVDVNISRGEIVGETKLCDNQSIFDPFFKKCRVIKCALRGYSIIGGQCVKALA